MTVEQLRRLIFDNTVYGRQPVRINLPAKDYDSVVDGLTVPDPRTGLKAQLPDVSEFTFKGIRIAKDHQIHVPQVWK